MAAPITPGFSVLPQVLLSFGSTSIPKKGLTDSMLSSNLPLDSPGAAGVFSPLALLLLTVDMAAQ